MKTHFILFVISIFVTFASSSGQSVGIAIKDARVVNDSLILTIALTNRSQMSAVVLKPTPDLICLGVMKVFCQEEGNQKTYDLFPCDGVYQPDEIELDCSNGIVLKKDSVYVTSLTFHGMSLKPLSPGKMYQCHIELLMKDINLKSEFLNPCMENLLSKAITIQR